MPEKRPFQFFVLRYAPNVVKGEFVNIGILMVELSDSGAGYAGIEFARNWDRVYRLDRQADVEWLQAMERDIRAQLAVEDQRKQLIVRLRESFSGAVQISEAKGYLCAEPEKELASLAALYTETDGSDTVQRKPSGRQSIVSLLRHGFEDAGVLGLVMQGLPVEHYTRRGDRFKFDFGYRVKNELKGFQAVSLRTDLDGAILLAARTPTIAKRMEELSEAHLSLTAVVENDFDRNDISVQFAVNMMQEAQIRVAEAREVQSIALQAKIDLAV